MNVRAGSVASLKPFKHSVLWLALWWLAIVVLVVLCLLPASDIPEVPNGWDKVEHAFAYMVLAFGAVQLFAARRALFRAAVGLMLLGIAIEIAQGVFTATRSADVFDALADAVGIIIGIAAVRTPLRDFLLEIERKVF